MKRAPHTSTTPGKRVIVTLRDGAQIEGKFVEKRSRFLVIEIGGVERCIVKREIKQFIVSKGAQR